MSDARSATLDAITTLARANGIGLDEIIAGLSGAPASGPTLADYIDTHVRPALSAGCRKVWEPYLRLLVEGYPGDTAGRKATPSFMWAGTVSMFERNGFARDRRIGKHHWVVRREIAPA